MSVRTPRAKTGSPADQSARAGVIPPLKDGDRLTRDEFERRYDAMPNLRKAELIEGVVHVPSAVRQRNHSAPHFNLIGWLSCAARSFPDSGSIRTHWFAMI